MMSAIESSTSRASFRWAGKLLSPNMWSTPWAIENTPLSCLNPAIIPSGGPRPISTSALSASGLSAVTNLIPGISADILSCHSSICSGWKW